MMLLLRMILNSLFVCRWKRRLELNSNNNSANSNNSTASVNQNDLAEFEAAIQDPEVLKMLEEAAKEDGDAKKKNDK